MNSEMKKVLVSCLVIVMAVSMSLTVLAAPGGFVSSPSGNPAPIVITFTCGDEACTATLVITPYGDKAELSAALRTMLEKAYSQISNAKDLTTLNAGLAAIASSKNINGANLAVSDLFDIHYTGCDYHEGHHDFDITLDADTLSRFVALLHMNASGEWELVSDAKVVNNGEHLQFSVDSFSPFAIVVDTTTPNAGDSTMIYVYASAMVLSAAALAVVLVKGRKHRA